MKYSIYLFTVLAFISALSCSKESDKHELTEQQILPQTEQTDSLSLKEYVTKGKELAVTTKAQLGKNLMAAMQKAGPTYAVDFCNTRAIPITDSMATALHASIKRVAVKYRNPDNKANAKETEYILNAEKRLAEGKKLSPYLDELQNKVIAYYPIMTNSMCLNCHGTLGKELKQETYDVILENYPEDKAIGYSENQIRGIWVIEMEK